MNKILLIYPPSVKMNRTARCQQPLNELIILPPLPPTDLMYCASIAKQYGNICKIKDYSLENGTFETLKNDIKIFQPDILFANITSTTFENDMQAVIEAKKLDKNILTITSGAHFLEFNTSVLEKYLELDIIIRGEPEFTFQDIISGKNLSEIDGITYRLNNEIISNKNRIYKENLDELPLPARDLINNELYIRPDTGEKQAIIKVASGCPYHCFFCLATPFSGSKVRYRNVDNIIAEIKECIQKYDIYSFVFWSDLFTADKNFVKNLCSKINQEVPNIKWSANSRVDTIDLETLTLMKNSGCTLISFGIESGSQEILDKIGKKITKNQALQAVEMCKKLGIQTFTYYILGLPWENETHIKETIDFSIKLDSDYVNYYTAVVFPGTRFYDYVIQNNLGNLKDFYINPYYYPCIATNYLSKDKVQQLNKYAVKKFYLRPKYIFRKLKEIKSFSQFKNYFKAGLAVFFKK
ncbi:radical SAM protein [bacterium]|nr:radical SAM protein [bacterium]